jgi:hypothetical protein
MLPGWTHLLSWQLPTPSMAGGMQQSGWLEHRSDEIETQSQHDNGREWCVNANVCRISDPENLVEGNRSEAELRPVIQRSVVRGYASYAGREAAYYQGASIRSTMRAASR